MLIPPFQESSLEATLSQSTSAQSWECQKGILTREALGDNGFEIGNDVPEKEEVSFCRPEAL